MFCFLKIFIVYSCQHFTSLKIILSESNRKLTRFQRLYLRQTTYHQSTFR
nr:MAG TPA: hypothetical protein [Caudoviricetes sp.]